MLIQTQLSKRLETFSQDFAQFLESTSNFKNFWRKRWPWKFQIVKVMVRQMFKYSRFITLFYGQYVKGSSAVVKSPWEYSHPIVLSLWGKQTWKISFLLIFEILRLIVKHWLPMTRIFFVIFGICRNYFKCNYLKN